MPEFLRWRIRLPPTVISSGTERRGRKSEMQNFSGRQCDSANLRFHTRTFLSLFSGLANLIPVEDLRQSGFAAVVSKDQPGALMSEAQGLLKTPPNVVKILPDAPGFCSSPLTYAAGLISVWLCPFYQGHSRPVEWW